MKLDKHLIKLVKEKTLQEDKVKKEEIANVSHEVATNMTKEIICSYVSHNTLDKKDLLEMIENVYDCLKDLGSDKKKTIDIASTIHNSYLICLEDGKKMKMLTKYLKQKYSLTPQAYRAKWSLPSDYPMVAPGYSKHRSAIAKKHGFGSKSKEVVEL